ncbi:MAG: ABC transporter substrate-binding protein [Pseudomonadota bacterium]
MLSFKSIAAFFSLVALVACQPADQQDGKVEQGFYPGAIEVGHLVALDMAPLFVAVEKGYFDQEGLDVNTRFFANPGDNNAALASGDLQLTVNPFTLPYLGAAAGGDFQFVASAGGVGVMEIVAQGELGVSSFEELIEYSRTNGSSVKIGSLRGDTLDVVVFKALEDRGSSYEDFEMVWFNDLLAMVQAFKAGEIDVLSHIKPYTTDLIVNFDAVSLGTNSSIWGVGTPNCVTMVMGDFADQYPKTVEAYLKAIRRGYQDIIDDPVEAAKLLSEGNYYQVDEQVLIAAMRSLPDEVYLRPNMNGVNTAIEDLVEQGYMEPVERPVYDPSFLDAIDQEL